VDHTTRQIQSQDRTRLHIEQWAPAGPPRFVVALSHGAAEHTSRYARVAGWFGERGGLTFGHDHRGQGLSGGPPGHVESFSVYADDLNSVLRTQMDALPAEAQPDKIPWFLFGHSMGGLVALTYLLDHAGRHPFAGAIISAPLLGLTMKVPPFKAQIGKLAARLLPRLTLPSGLPPTSICRDPGEVAVYKADRRRVDKVSARWFAAMNEAVARVSVDASKLDLPMLWYIGTGDLICDPLATRALFDRMIDPTARAQSLRTFEGYYHELHNEPELLRQPIKEMLLGWVDQRMNQPEPA
jgi:alpha-beta hydrolase superfamily lysophospholipase